MKVLVSVELEVVTYGTAGPLPLEKPRLSMQKHLSICWSLVLQVYFVLEANVNLIDLVEIFQAYW